MAKYIKNFVTGHGITFDRNKRNLEAFEKAKLLWETIGSELEITQESIVMLCGAKNNGKSSLMRYLVNRYNHPNVAPFTSNNQFQCDSNDFEMMDDPAGSTHDNSGRCAYFFDCDPGQAEMTSPGMVSAHLIKSTDALLESPTYLNINKYEPIVISSIGGINMSVNPRMYIENCRFVFNQVKQHWLEQPTKGPIFVNTMGHIRNVGLAMLIDLIKICRPTNLIVLNVESDPMRTIYADLSPSAIDTARASFYYETTQRSKKKLNYLCDVRSLEFAFVDSSATASKNRTALQLAYLASIPEALYKPIMQLSAKWISLENVYIHCVSSYPLREGIVLELLHHSWVHLVKIRRLQNQLVQQEKSQATISTNEHSESETNPDSEQQPRFCKLLDDVGENTLFGCGIVAEIDISKRRLAIITPVDQKTLDEAVDCLIKPLSIQVPREVLQQI